MSITRRGLLAGIFASVTAPAIVRASSLMPIVAPKIILPRHFYWNPDLILIRSNGKKFNDTNEQVQPFARGQTAGSYHVDEFAFFKDRTYSLQVVSK